MLKKSLSIILSLVMLITIFPSMTILGALPTDDLVIDADGNVTTEGVAVDDFDHNQNLFSGQNAYTNSSVFVEDTAYGGNGGFFLVEQPNASGVTSKMLKMQGRGWNQVRLPIRPIKFKSGQSVRFSYDLCFETLSTDSSASVSIGANNNDYNLRVIGTTPGVNVYYETKSFQIKEDTWYKVIVEVSAGGKHVTYLTDTSTGEILVNTLPNIKTYAEGNKLDIYAVAHTGKANGAVVLLDNAKLEVYTPSEAYAPSVIKTSTGNTGVAIDAGTMEITFDQPIATAPASVSLTAEGKTTLTATVAKVSNKLNTYKLSLPVMEGLTTYTADLSGFKNAGNGTASSYSFTTAASAPVVLSSIPEDGAIDVSAETKSVTVTFDQSMTDYPATLSLAGGITATVTPDTDNKVFTISWNEALAGNTTYTISLAEFKNASGKVSSTASVSFTTENLNIIKQEDSFEDSSLIDRATQYNAAGNVEKSPLMLTSGNWDNTLELVEGYKTGYAIRLKSGSGWKESFKTVQKYPASANTKLVATYRFRIDELATDNTLIALGAAYGGSYAPSQWDSATTIQTKDTDNDGVKELVAFNPSYSNETPAEIEVDTWYNIIFVSASDRKYIYIVNAETGVLVYSKDSSYSNTYGSENYIFPYTAQDYNTDNSGLVTTIDDFTLYQIKSDLETQKLAVEGVSGENGTFTMSFNQPILADADMFALYKDEAVGTAGALSNEQVYIIPDVEQADFCKVKVSYNGLESLSDYTIDYSGMKAVSGADLGDSKATSFTEFTTSPLDDDMYVYGDITCNGMTEGSELSLKIYSKNAKTADIITAFYDRSFPNNLSTAMITEDVTLSQGENTVTIPLTQDIDADIVKIFVWDDMETMVPLMKDYKALTPVDKLDILMIGSSLTEDTGRLFDGVLESSGHSVDENRDIDITVRAVGGGHFTYHYNNLKRELEAKLDEAIRNNDADAIAAYVEEQKQIMEEEAANEQNSSRRLYFDMRNGVLTDTKANPKDSLLISALMEKQYDYITLQPSAHAYTTYDDYAEELEYLTAKIRELQPNAEIVLFQTWMHCDSAKTIRNDYFLDNIKPFVDSWAENTGKYTNITAEGDPLTISPVGYAFYLADNFYDWCGTRFNLSAGDNSAAAKTDLTDLFNTSNGLLRDYDHASYYGSFLSDAVWYEVFTGNRASAGTVDNPAVPVPSGKTAENIYFTITDAEHFARLEALADIAHDAVSMYKTSGQIYQAN